MPYTYASLSNVLKRVDPTYKEAIGKRLKLLLSDYYREELPSGDTVVPLSKLFEILGKAKYRLGSISDLKKLLGDALGYSTITGSFKELEDLHTLCMEQVKVATEMINATTHYNLKQEEVPA